MNDIKPLDHRQLCKCCDPSGFGFQTTDDLEDVDLVVGQSRARDALEFGVRIQTEGYNVFALGPPGVGKLSAVRQLVAREALNRAVPVDWCYVNNFSESTKPRSLRLPAGRGKALQRDMEQLVEELGNSIPAAFEGEHYQTRVHELNEEVKERQRNAITELREQARVRHFALLETPAGFAFAPLGEQEQVLSPEQFGQLSEPLQKDMESTAKELQQQLQKLMRQFPIWQKEMRAKLKALNQEIARFAVNHSIEVLEERYADLSEVLDYMKGVEHDIVEHVEQFLPRPDGQSAMLGEGPRSAPLDRFKVNLLVSHSGEQTAPVVYEDLPNYSNLIGRVEHRAHMGTLVSDFTLIRPGALHRANGGYLIVEALKLLRQPFAWDALKRALRSREIRIESLERTLSLVSTTSLEPQPMPLDVKVILLGERMHYYLLCEYDPEFSELFKVAADFDESTDRSADAHQDYARVFATVLRREGLRPLDRAAVARLIDHLSRLAGDSEKLSTHLRQVIDILREADYWAGVAGREVLAVEDIQCTIDQQKYRSARIRDRMYEQICRGTVMIDDRGQAVGQVNGLSVIQLGDFAFGRPSRITATTRVGEGEVIDIERETELGGPIHSKGVLILSNFLASRYAPGQPLSMTASLVFEQSYGPVEGDSASLAELCAVLSSLAGLPLRQSLALTGSVNQHGQVQPIGGVNEKIEGFFDVCEARGLTGEQGVVIPATNIANLMLREDVVEAVAASRFHVYSASSVDEAMQLLTGVSAGVADELGTFPPDSVNGCVEQRLVELYEARRRFTRDSDGQDAADADSQP